MPKTNREDIIRRVRAIQNRTVDRGCTEAEALTAAGIMAALMDEYGLAMTDIEIEQQNCEGLEIETGRKRSHEIEFCFMTIAHFTDCKGWGSRRGGKIINHFFGLPEDVRTARWLYGLISNAMRLELSQYKKTCRIFHEPTGRTQSHAFLMGMVNRVNARLRDTKSAQRYTTAVGTGRDLVLVKSATVNAGFAKLNLNLTSNNRKTSIRDSGAYSAGQDAGNRVGFKR